MTSPPPLEMPESRKQKSKKAGTQSQSLAKFECWRPDTAPGPRAQFLSLPIDGNFLMRKNLAS